MKKVLSFLAAVLMVCFLVPSALAADLEGPQLNVVVSNAYSDIIEIVDFKSYYFDAMANFDVSFENSGENTIESVDFLFIPFDENLTYISSFNAKSEIALEPGMVVDDNWVNLELKGIDTVVLFVNGVTYADGSYVKRNIEGYKDSVMQNFNPPFTVSGSSSQSVDAFMVKGGRLVVDFIIEKTTDNPNPTFMVEVRNVETNKIEGVAVWFDNSPLERSKTMILNRGQMYYLNILAQDCNYTITVTHYI